MAPLLYRHLKSGNIKLEEVNVLMVHSCYHACMHACAPHTSQVDGSYEDWLEVLRLVYFSGKANFDSLFF